MDGAVGQSIDDYASQVAGINQQIDGIVKGGVLPQNDVSYERLKAQRAGIAAKAQALADQTKKAGAAAPDFNAAVKKASSALKTPKEAAPAEPQSSGLDRLFKGTYETQGWKRDDFDKAMQDGGLDRLYDSTYKEQGWQREDFDKAMGAPPAAEKTPAAEAPGVEPAPGTRPMEQKDLPAAAQAVRGIGAPPAGVDPKENFEALAALRTKLKAAGKVPEQDPEYIALLKKRSEGIQNENRSAAQFLAPSGAGIAGVGEKLAGKAGQALAGAKGVVGDTVRTFSGSAAKKALEDVRSSATGEVGKATTAETAAATEAEKQAAALKAKKAEVASQQPRLAATRADSAAASNPGKPDATLGRKGALTRLQEETAGTEKQLGEAKGATEAAGKEVEAATSRESAAKEASSKLDEDLKAKPGISKEEFGTKLESAVRETNTRLKKLRAKEADYGGTLDRAGKVPDIETGHIEKHIDDVLESTIRNDKTRTLLTKIKRELTSTAKKEGGEGEEAVNKLTLRQADSLRKNLGEAIADKVYDGDAVSSEALTVLKDVRKQLTEAAIGHHEDYAKALGKFSTHSRPLEFIEKNPLLRKVVVDNPNAAEAAVTRSQIVGKLLTEANRSDRKALARLMTESPELRKSARLYFTQDLFGPEGLKSTQSSEQLRKWLVKNKPSLDQLGIAKEFKDIKTARDTANKAIADATGTLKQSEKTLKAAAETEKEIQRKLTARQKLQSRASSEVDKFESARQATLEAKKADVAKRAGAAQERLGKESESAAATAEKRQKAAAEYKRLGTEIGAATKEELPGKADAVFKQLAKDGQLTSAQYDKVIRLVDEAKAKIKDTEQLRARVKRIVKSAIYLYAGYKALRTAGEFFN